MKTFTMTPEEFQRFKSWEQVLEDGRATDDAVARCENTYMKWLLSRQTGELTIMRSDLVA